MHNATYGFLYLNKYNACQCSCIKAKIYIYVGLKYMYMFIIKIRWEAWGLLLIKLLIRIEEYMYERTRDILYVLQKRNRFMFKKKDFSQPINLSTDLFLIFCLT